jgi:hypothetical protein
VCRHRLGNETEYEQKSRYRQEVDQPISPSIYVRDTINRRCNGNGCAILDHIERQAKMALSTLKFVAALCRQPRLRRSSHKWIFEHAGILPPRQNADRPATLTCLRHHEQAVASNDGEVGYRGGRVIEIDLQRHHRASRDLRRELSFLAPLCFGFGTTDK